MRNFVFQRSFILVVIDLTKSSIELWIIVSVMMNISVYFKDVNLILFVGPVNGSVLY